MGFTEITCALNFNTAMLSLRFALQAHFVLLISFVHFVLFLWQKEYCMFKRKGKDLAPKLWLSLIRTALPLLGELCPHINYVEIMQTFNLQTIDMTN